MKKRIFSLLLVTALLLTLLPGVGLTVSAAGKEEKTRVIGIVFDDSGSMYNNGNNAWCRATYAMEVFAAMLNEGDKLYIYPMNGIQLGGTGKEYTSSNPLVIDGPDESSKVRQIMSSGGDTPIESIDDAYKSMCSLKADEKYLIVLTDGSEFYENGANLGGATKSKLTERLGQCCQDMFVMYLGIGTSGSAPDIVDPSKQIFMDASNSTEILQKLTRMCNTIFGRNELTGVTKDITFDVSLSKLIVFVQGNNVSDVSVSDGTKIRSTDTHYPEKGRTDGAKTITDETLQGMLVTYGEFDAGTYTLNYTGDATNVSVYYEPDVDLQIRMLDENGNVVDPTKGLTSGVYSLQYGMIDRDGNPTDSNLLGTTNYQITYVINGEEFPKSDTGSGAVSVDLHGGDKFSAKFNVTYLEDYVIRKDSEELGWSSDVNPAGVSSVRAEVTGGSEAYELSELEDQAVYDVTVYYGSEQVSGSDLANADLQVELTGGNAEYSVERTDSGFTVKLKYCGDATGTDCGKYELSIVPTYTNRDGETASGNAVERKFTVSDNSSFVAAEFRSESTFFQSSKLDEAGNIELVLSVGGNPLTAEQFAKAEVQIDTAGLDCTIQADAAGSRYLITLPTENVENGKYKLTCQAQIPNEIGRMTDSSDAMTIEIQPFPAWVKLLLRILIVLLILAVIWIYLNTKILPKRIGAGKCTFIVDGSIIPGSPSCVFTGGNKKRGTLEVTSPKYMANPAVKCGFRLELEAISPRRTKSSARSVKVRNVTALSPNTTSIHIGSLNMIRDPNTGRLVKSGGKADAPIEFNISNNAKASVTAEVMDVIDGNEITVSLSLPLKFF